MGFLALCPISFYGNTKLTYVSGYKNLTENNNADAEKQQNQ